MEDRRTFLKTGLGIAFLGAAGAETPAAPLSGLGRPSSRYLMIIDLNKCNGCESCVIACKAGNRTASGSFLTRVSHLESPPSSPFAIQFKPVLCNQCDDPPCAAACPEKATYKLAGGIVFTDWKLCKGLGDCVRACPYGARSLDPRFGNKSDKCDFCMDRVGVGLQPACVENCPPGARLFGDRNEPSGLFAEYLKRGNLVSDRPDLGISTNVLYVPLKGKRQR